MITQAENPGLWKQCKKLNYAERACIDKSDLNPDQLFHMGKTKLYAQSRTLGWYSYKEMQESDYYKIRIIITLERRKNYDWDRANGRPSGVSCNILFLDHGYGYKGINFIII